jgi:hypothetical protein
VFTVRYKAENPVDLSVAIVIVDDRENALCYHEKIFYLLYLV